ncbi:MAG: hypothetical protein AB7D06_11830 [Pedobacter sp.]
MVDAVTKRMFNNKLAEGFAGITLCFVASMVLWPLWSLVAQKFFSLIASQGLAAAGPELSVKLLGAMVESSFMWMVVCAWIWMSLIFDNFGKTVFTKKQPFAGISYFVVGMVLGTIGFLVLIGFIGIWWKPFNLGVMFSPANASEAEMALKGWEASNFYSLMVVMVQIAFASLMHKWPFAGTSKEPIASFGVFAFSTCATYIGWVALVVPSFMPLSIDGATIINVPFGSFPSFVAFALGFIFFSVLPVEGGELYPMVFFAKKQPYMGMVGVLFAIAGGFVLPAVTRGIVEPLNLLPGAPVDIVVSSLELTVIIMMLAWHHLFESYPSPNLVPNSGVRILVRITIWVVSGSVLGVLWIKFFPLLPIGGNNLGLGFHTMGVLAGQFTFLLTLLFFDTFWDKWPLIRKA